MANETDLSQNLFKLITTGALRGNNNSNSNRNKQQQQRVAQANNKSLPVEHVASNLLCSEPKANAKQRRTQACLTIGCALSSISPSLSPSLSLSLSLLRSL